MTITSFSYDLFLSAGHERRPTIARTVLLASSVVLGVLTALPVVATALNFLPFRTGVITASVMGGVASAAFLNSIVRMLFSKYEKIEEKPQPPEISHPRLDQLERDHTRISGLYRKVIRDTVVRSIIKNFPNKDEPLRILTHQLRGCGEEADYLMALFEKGYRNLELYTPGGAEIKALVEGAISEIPFTLNEFDENSTRDIHLLLMIDLVVNGEEPLDSEEVQAYFELSQKALAQKAIIAYTRPKNPDETATGQYYAGIVQNEESGITLEEFKERKNFFLAWNI